MARPGLYSDLGQNREESGVRTSSAKTSLPVYKTKLELGVRDDDPPRGGIFGGGAIDPQRQIARRPSSCRHPNFIHNTIERNVFVVSCVGLGQRGEYRLGQLVTLAQSGRQRNAAYRAGVAVFLPPRS